MAHNGITIDLKFAKETKSLQDFINTPFTDREGASFIAESYNSQNLNINLSTTSHYTNPGQMQSQLPVARIPIFHPYNPTAAIANTITVRCPKDAYAFLPENIKHTLAMKGVNPAQIDIFFSSQNIPVDWAKNVSKQPIIFRPHYYVHGFPQFDKNIREGVFNQAPSCEIGLFATSATPIRMDGIVNQMAPAKLMVSSHSQTMRPRITPSQVICSPSKPGILSGIDFKTSHALYSVVITPEKRVAVTLHWLLSQEDQARLNLVSHIVRARKGGIRHLIEEIEHFGPHSSLNAKNGPLACLKKMFNAANVNSTKNLSANLGLTEEEQLALALDYSRLSTESKRSTEAAVRTQINAPRPPANGQISQPVDRDLEQALLAIALAESRALSVLNPAQHVETADDNLRQPTQPNPSGTPEHKADFDAPLVPVPVPVPVPVSVPARVQPQPVTPATRPIQPQPTAHPVLPRRMIGRPNAALPKPSPPTVPAGQPGPKRRISRRK